MMLKGLVGAAVVLTLVGCGDGGRGMRNGPGDDAGGATGDGGGTGGADGGDAQPSDLAGDAAGDATGGTDGGIDGTAADAGDGGAVQCTPGTKQCAGSNG